VLGAVPLSFSSRRSHDQLTNYLKLPANSAEQIAEIAIVVAPQVGSEG
jgi:hypothetical protein